jgi:hypothetical protein
MPETVFSGDQQTNTASAVPAAGVDNHIPTEGSAANWGSITSENFLAGPKPGQEQSLIKVGDQTVQIASGQNLRDVKSHATTNVLEGDDTINFYKNHKTLVVLDETHTVNGKQETFVKKDRTVAVTQNISESANLKITIAAGVELLLQGPGGSIKIDATGVTIQGVLVKIN